MSKVKTKPSTLYEKKKEKDFTSPTKENASRKKVFKIILVGRRKFKFWTTFVCEARMMKKLPQKLLCFSPHR